MQVPYIKMRHRNSCMVVVKSDRIRTCVKHWLLPSFYLYWLSYALLSLVYLVDSPMNGNGLVLYLHIIFVDGEANEISRNLNDLCSCSI
jgi:hypothetical protein